MPCLFLTLLVSAALNLGCVPRRASRSQRHSNPVCYLSPNTKELTDVSQKPHDNSNANQPCSKSMLPPLLPIQSSNLHVPATQFGSKYSAVGPEIQFMPSNASEVQKYSLEIPNMDLACKAREFPMPMESCIWPDLGCVYPLYYCPGPYLPTSQPQQEQMVSNIFCATKPSVLSNGGAHCNKKSNLVHNMECNLLLRLGPPSPPSSEIESSWSHEVEDVGSSSSCEGGKSCGPLPKGTGFGAVNLESSLSSARDKGFDFFSADHVDEHHESCSSKWSSQGDCTLYMNGYD